MFLFDLYLFFCVILHRHHGGDNCVAMSRDVILSISWVYVSAGGLFPNAFWDAAAGELFAFFSIVSWTTERRLVAHALRSYWAFETRYSRKDRMCL